MTAASAQQEAHELYRRMVKLECDSTFAFQGSRWLGDVAPHLLPVDQQAMFAEAKVKAAARVRLESAITPSMLYVKGWPTRMLSDVEADILSVVRRGISAMFGFQSACLDRDSVHARYAELIELNRQKDASRIKEGA
jgi:hypothetical protein